MLAHFDDVSAIFVSQPVGALQQLHRFRGFPSREQVRFESSSGRVLSRNKCLDPVVAQQREQLVFFVEAHLRLSVMSLSLA